jgi:hypothetical protein
MEAFGEQNVLFQEQCLREGVRELLSSFLQDRPVKDPGKLYSPEDILPENELDLEEAKEDPRDESPNPTQSSDPTDNSFPAASIDLSALGMAVACTNLGAANVFSRVSKAIPTWGKLALLVPSAALLGYGLYKQHNAFSKLKEKTNETSPEPEDKARVALK